MRLPVQLILVGAALGGCGGAPTMAVLPPGQTGILLGTGVDGFTPFVDGQMAQVIHGPQGGYHVVVAVLAQGIWPGTVGQFQTPDDPTTTLQAFRAAGAEFEITGELLNVFHSAYLPADAGATWLPNKYLRFMITSPTEIAGEQLRLRATVVDRDGRRASDEKHVVAVPPKN